MVVKVEYIVGNVGMRNLIESIQTFLNLPWNVEGFQIKLLQTLGLVFFLWFLRFIIIKIVYYETKDLHTRYWWQKMTTYLVVSWSITSSLT